MDSKTVTSTATPTVPTLPNLKDEHIRLWRGVGCTEPDCENVGEYWTVYRHLAEEYCEADLDEQPVKGALFYLDVPADAVISFRSIGRGLGEFILPAELTKGAVRCL